MDYRTNGLGEALNENAGNRTGQSLYQVLYEPQTAGPFLLNLEGGQTALGASGEEDKVVYWFGDGSSVLLHMVQPFGADGIWVPAGWSITEELPERLNVANTPAKQAETDSGTEQEPGRRENTESETGAEKLLADGLEPEATPAEPGADSYTYLGLKLVRDGERWLVAEYYLEK